MSVLTQVEKRPQVYEWLFLFSYLMINNTINATSILMESSRFGRTLTFPVWEPFVLEYSSALSASLLIPLVFLLLKWAPLNWLSLKKNLLWHLLGSVAFSLAHVAIMVLLRKLAFMSQQMTYTYGELPVELFYEYRKDAWLYVLVVLASYCFRFILSRMIGEAQLVADGEDGTAQDDCDRLLVKKLGKEFIIKVEDIEWLESSGNYVNLHIKGRIYPTRATLGALVEQLSHKGFCRVHRSYGINLDAVSSIAPQASGDAEITLLDGKVLSLSRRYREEFKSRLS